MLGWVTNRRDQLRLLKTQIEGATNGIAVLARGMAAFNVGDADVGPVLVAGMAPLFAQLKRLSAQAKTPNPLQEAAKVAVGIRKTTTPSNLRALVALGAALSAVLPALEQELANPDRETADAVEIAFAHLKRLIVVEDDVRKKWQTAYKKGEVHCEKLGDVHMLRHRLWAFKSDATGARTDLVLGDPLEQIDTAQLHAARGLVLTEWKVATKSDLDAKLKSARIQLARYKGGALLGAELTSVQYVIAVSLEQLPMPSDVVQNGVRIRHINIAVRPKAPSKANAP